MSVTVFTAFQPKLKGVQLLLELRDWDLKYLWEYLPSKLAIGCYRL